MRILSPLILGSLLLLAVFGSGCVPLGDPEKSVVDNQFHGWYIGETPGKLLYVAAYDPRTYIITLYDYEGEGSAAKLQSRTTCKAWMNTVGGMDILCCKMIDPEWSLALPDPVYVYFRIRRPDGLDWNAREVTMLSVDFLKDAKTPEELAKKIAGNVKNPELWKEASPTVFHPASDKQTDDVIRLIRAFSPPKQIPFQVQDAFRDVH